jgi:hypothetical protein
MSLIRQVLALDDDAPLCTSCAAALGGRGRDKIATVSVTRCAHCHEQRPCLAARDFDLPAAPAKTRAP